MEEVYEIEEQIYNKLLYEYVLSKIELLSLKEKEVLKLRYGIGKISYETEKEASKTLNVTRERVRMLEASGLRKVRKLVKNDKRY